MRKSYSRREILQSMSAAPVALLVTPTIHAMAPVSRALNRILRSTSTVHDCRRMETAVRRMIERRVDAVAILTFGMEERLIADLRLLRTNLFLRRSTALVRSSR